MQKSLIIILAFFTTLCLNGQIETVFYGYHGYDCNSIIREDSTGVYFYATKDSSKIVVITNHTTYKLYDRSYKLLVEGDLGSRIYVDYYKRFGKWTEYYSNGKIQSEGYYYENEPIGLWQFYFENGNLKKTYSISLIQTDSSWSFCKVGLYQEYYENSQLKVNGFFKTSVDSMSIEVWGNDPDKTEYTIVRQPVSKKFGIWTHYKENGLIEKREDLRYGE